MTSQAKSLLAVLLVVVLLQNVSGDRVVIPPFDVSQDAFLALLNLRDIKFDVPALYVFGDSTVDSGNNNNLNTTSKSNYLPYGIDFAGGKPTGRYTNGRTTPDFMAQLLGLPFPPAYLGLSQEENRTVHTGVNYGSASCGILPKIFLGECIYFTQQINNFEATVENLKSYFNSTESLRSHLSKSLFLTDIGNTDLSESISDLKGVKFSDYARNLSGEFQKMLQRLYNLGARKFLVNNIGLLACAPSRLIRNNVTNMTECVDDKITQNWRVNEYNRILSKLLPKLQSSLPGSKFVLGDVNKVLKDVIKSPNSYGITDTRNPCCKFKTLVKNGSLISLPCSVEEPIPCKNRNEHAFFDPFHVSETVHYLWAKRCLIESSICSPINLVKLLQA